MILKILIIILLSLLIYRIL